MLLFPLSSASSSPRFPFLKKDIKKEQKETNVQAATDLQ
jgi:hypothetical protein